MVWGAVAGAGMQVIGGIMKAKAAAEAQLADKKLQRKRLNIMRSRQQTSYDKNTSAIDRTELDNALAIEESRLDAQSELSSALAGSGISGSSVGELSAEVSTDAAEAHNDNVRTARETGDELFSDRANTQADLQFELENTASFDSEAALTSAIAGGAATGVQSAVNSGAFKGGE